MTSDAVRRAGMAAMLIASLVSSSIIAADDADKTAARAPLESVPAALDQEVDFVRDVRPILARSCHSCHGPDVAEGSLRLDQKTPALQGGASGPAIMPGKGAESRLVQYAAGANDDRMLMPPEGEGEPLAQSEVALLRTWIDRGAVWPDDASEDAATSDHWAFRPLADAPPTPVKNVDWVRNEIDQFVLARLEAEGIVPAPEADRATLIKRLSLDLTGLPPTPGEVVEFLADESPTAYADLVERLLRSPHYGERWGRHWLDLARYADSDGYEKDTPRPHAWRFRNWVIDAVNRDLPFDQFTIEQLAGDLLPGATSEQIAATGFHRNTLLNKEGGVDQEEFRVAATVDRANTTGAVWLGMTFGCAQCHSHKYDPLTQREYFGLYAFFNNLDDVDALAPLPEEATALAQAQAEFDAEHQRLVQELHDYQRTELAEKFVLWEATANAKEHCEWRQADIAMAKSESGAALARQYDGSLLAEGDTPENDVYTLVAVSDLRRVSGLRVDVLADERLPSMGPGRTPQGNFVLTEVSVGIESMTDTNGRNRATPIEIAGAVADFSQDGFSAEAVLDGESETGWAVSPRMGRDHALAIEFREPFELDNGQRLVVKLEQRYGQQHAIGRLRLSATDSRGPLELDGLPADVRAALEKPRTERTPADRDALATHHRQRDPEWRRLKRAVDRHARNAPERSTTLAQALGEHDPPRETHILVRGDFLRPGAAVAPHTPAVLPPLECAGEAPTRLDLAKWLVSDKNPLTPRVTVNRVWQRCFGRGLVATVDDFGTQGEQPSHPELLDWLARSFVNGGWRMKDLHRLIVHSATYRQSSATRPELTERDPFNRLLARQNRLRVEAEVVRDLALAASGLLNPAIGGPSVRPPQPDGVAELGYADSVKWEASQGADRHRRGMYTFFQRTVPYPMLMTFDAPDSNVTCARRERSNTPLQALTLLNDPVFVECAQALGRRIVAETPDSDPAARARRAWLLCLAREPSTTELAEVVTLYNAQRAHAESDAAAAAEIVGREPRPDGASTAEIAAWMLVGRTILNLDELITRE